MVGWGTGGGGGGGHNYNYINGMMKINVVGLHDTSILLTVCVCLCHSVY